MGGATCTNLLPDSLFESSEDGPHLGDEGERVADADEPPTIIQLDPNNSERKRKGKAASRSIEGVFST